jgi:nitrogenase subunit NifH
LHDLKRLVEVLQKFRLQAGCIINKADLNPDQAEALRTFSIENNIDLLGEIPYDPAFTAAMIRGKTIVESDNQLKQIMNDIFHSIQHKINVLTKKRHSSKLLITVAFKLMRMVLAQQWRSASMSCILMC